MFLFCIALGCFFFYSKFEEYLQVTKIHGECPNAEKNTHGKFTKGRFFSFFFFFFAVFCIVCQLAFCTHINWLPVRLTNAPDGIVSN